MDFLLIGASGMIGRRIAEELVGRGHQVTGVTRSGEPFGLDNPLLTVVAADATDTAAISGLAVGRDAVVSAAAPPRDGSAPAEAFLTLSGSLIKATRSAATQRLVVIGGAGTLEVAPQLRLMDSPGFPAAYRPEAEAQALALDLYRSIDDLDWTYISPAPEIAPGERTGTYRIGGDQLMEGADHHSRISAEDFAVAVADELERGDAVKRRISVASRD